MTEQNDRGCEDPLEVSGPTLLKAGPDRSGPRGLVQLSAKYPCDRFPNLSHLVIQPLTTFVLKRIHDTTKWVGCEREKNYSFSLTLIMYSLFNTFIHTQMLLIVLNDGGVSIRITTAFFFHRISINPKSTRKRCTSAISTSCVTCTYRLRTTQVSNTPCGVCLKSWWKFLTLSMLYSNIWFIPLEKIVWLSYSSWEDKKLRSGPFPQAK